MNGEKPNFLAELARFRKDPRIKLFAIGGISAKALELVDLAGVEIADLQRRVAELERHLAGLGALRVSR